MDTTDTESAQKIIFISILLREILKIGRMPRLGLFKTSLVDGT